MRRRISPRYLLLLPVFLGLSLLVYNIPFVHSRVAWRVENLRVRLQYAINPPEQVVFQPQEQAALEDQVDAIVNATLTALAPTATLVPLTPAPTQAGPTTTPLPSPTPTPSPTPLPEAFRLEGI